jgi:hypothetical protein
MFFYGIFNLSRRNVLKSSENLLVLFEVDLNVRWEGIDHFIFNNEGGAPIGAFFVGNLIVEYI